MAEMSYMAKTERANIILLDESSVGQAKIRMKDGDTFFIPIAMAAQACKARDNTPSFFLQFKDLISVLDEWIEKYRSQIKTAHLTIREDGMLLLIMQRGIEFNAELSDALTELDMQIANDASLNLIVMDVLSIPEVSETSVGAFISSGDSFKYAE